MNRVAKVAKPVLRPVYRLTRLVGYQVLDTYDTLRGQKSPLIPPRRMIFIGDGDYAKAGHEFLSYFKELADLKPSHRVLDVGCGIGRMAVPLTGYLSKDTDYYGFDIVKSGVDWTTQHITSRYSNFHFEHANIYNKMYNPKGTTKSANFHFPYQDNYFDFVFLTSVFTHMHTPDVKQYLTEIARVMKRDSKCLITFFLLNQESEQMIKAGQSSQNLVHHLDEVSLTKNPDMPEAAIGFSETFIRKLFKDHDLDIQEIYYGAWPGRSDFKSYQDIVVARKS